LPNSQSSEEIEAAQNDSEIHLHKQKPAARSLLIDAVRGMAISLVALGHTNQGIIHRGWWGASKVGLGLDITIYAFHMPAFFFVSGIFLYASAEKRGPGRFTMERVRTLLYPYVLWTLISAGSVELLSQFTVQRPVNWHNFLPGLLRGYGIWFLPTLFACQVFGMALRKLPGVAILAIAVLAYYFVPQTSVNWLNMAVEFVPFVAAGMCVGSGYEQLEKIPRWLAVVLAVLLYWWLSRITVNWWNGHKYTILLGGAIGTLMLMMLARSFGRSKAARVFAWAGEASLAIYLAGEYGQGLVRQVMVWAHIIEPYSQLIVPTLAAIVIPAWVYQHRVRLHLDWLFAAPFWKARPRGPQTASAA
jgi:fucose 4-O-acetylase-like acetyltransferase